jgi:hypothetical protein
VSKPLSPLKETFDWLTGEEARSEFDSIFAPYILQYPGAKIIFDGKAVEPGRTVDRAHEFPKESIICPGRVIKDLTLRVMEWKAHVVLLCWREQASATRSLHAAN